MLNENGTIDDKLHKETICKGKKTTWKIIFFEKVFFEDGSRN